MQRYTPDLSGRSIHCAVEGACGGTSLGLHLAANAISDGGRVLWASPDMPDATRFSQLFAHLSLVESSRFHAMNLVGNMELATNAILDAMNGLPSVSLIVLDDWCSRSGRVAKDSIEQMLRLHSSKNETVCLLLISKGGSDASGSGQALVARAQKPLADAGYEIWKLIKDASGSKRELMIDSESTTLQIQDDGYFV